MTNFRRSPLSERNSLFQTVVFSCQRTLQAATGGLWRVSAGLPGILGLWRPAEQVSSMIYAIVFLGANAFLFKFEFVKTFEVPCSNIEHGRNKKAWNRIERRRS